MPELAGRLYIPKLYKLQRDRVDLVQQLQEAVKASGGRVIYCSYPDQQVAPVYIGLEDHDGGRWGVLAYPFRATKRLIRNRPEDEHRAQIRFGDPVRAREETNLIADDVAGVDVTVVLAVDPELPFFVGLDPLVYRDLPMGISTYYRDRDVIAAQDHGWSVWEKDKSSGRRRSRIVEIETLVGFHPHRFLDYVRFEARARALGLDPSLRASLAQQFERSPLAPHRLETFFNLTSAEILDIIEDNFRLGVAVRGGVAERHLERALADEPCVVTVNPIDRDGQPDFELLVVDGRDLLLECKTASSARFRNGDFKVEVQKTRDSGSGRQYTFDQFDVLAACLFPTTGVWEYRFRWTHELEPSATDPSRIKPIQRIDGSWSTSLRELLERLPTA